MPDTYHTAGIGGDRHLNFYGNRDNLEPPAVASNVLCPLLPLLSATPGNCGLSMDQCCSRRVSATREI